VSWLEAASSSCCIAALSTENYSSSHIEWRPHLYRDPPSLARQASEFAPVCTTRDFEGLPSGTMTELQMIPYSAGLLSVLFECFKVHVQSESNYSFGLDTLDERSPISANRRSCAAGGQFPVALSETGDACRRRSAGRGRGGNGPGTMASGFDAPHVLQT